MNVVQPKNGALVRLTHKRWFHITEEHSEIAGSFYEVLETISEPEAIFQDASEELLATPGKLNRENTWLLFTKR